MDRKKRIRVAIVAAVGLLALFIAFVGAPLIAVALWPEPDVSGDVDVFVDSITQAARTVEVANTVSLVSLLIAGVCIIYLLAVLAGWFIGPPERNATDQNV